MSIRCVIYHPNAGDVLSAGSLTVRVAVHPHNMNVRINLQEYGGAGQQVGPSPASNGLWSGNVSLNAGKFYFLSATGSIGGASDSHTISFSTAAHARNGKDRDKKKKTPGGRRRKPAAPAKPAD